MYRLSREAASRETGAEPGEHVPAGGVAEAREPGRGVARARRVAGGEGGDQIVQRRVAEAVGEVAEQRGADGMRARRGRGAHVSGEAAPAVRVREARVGEQPAREQRAADEIAAAPASSRAHASASARA